MVESFKRYYHNSFLDAQRQEAYNLFLGIYVIRPGLPMLWDLQTDYYLHHSHPRLSSDKEKRDYIQWYDPEHLEPSILPPAYTATASDVTQSSNGLSHCDGYWLEYYRPLSISSFAKIFSWKLSNRIQPLASHSYQTGPWNPSPFFPRKPPHAGPDTPDSPRKRPRKGVTIIDPHSDDQMIGTNLRLPNGEPQARHSILRDTGFGPPNTAALTQPYAPADKSAVAMWTLSQIQANSLSPAVTPAELEEYERYISHPLNLPLVTSTDEPDESNAANIEYIDYVNCVNSDMVEQFSLTNEWDIPEDDLANFLHFLAVPDNPLSIEEDDGEKKRYKAYRQWLKGKSFFKQSKVDPEYKS